MQAIMQTNQIIDQNAPKLLINYDVAEMIQRAVDVLKRFGKNVEEVELLGHKKMHGISYQDSVVTILSDRMKRHFAVYRNRTGTLVAGIANGIVNSYHWEIVFIDEHLKHLLEPQGNKL
jgi:hypothetical protein